jgi:hypothetical protein
VSEMRRFTVLLATVALGLAPRGVDAQDWRTLSQARQVAGERTLSVDVEYAAGQLRITPADAGTLYQMNLRYDADVFQPRVAYNAGRLRVGMDDATIRGRNMKSGLLDLRLTPDVPVQLELGFGAADAEIELGGVRVRNAAIKTGASRTRLNVATPNPESCRALTLEVGAARFEALGLGNLNAQRIHLQGGVGDVTLDFSGTWQQDMRGTIEMGLGTLSLVVPRGLGVRIRKTGLLASFDSQGLVKRGDVYYSEDWETAGHKLSLDIEAAFGSIKVVWLDS